MSLCQVNIKIIFVVVIVAKLVCIDDQISKLFKSYLVEDCVQKFILRMIKESEYIKNIFKRNLL